MPTTPPPPGKPPRRRGARPRKHPGVVGWRGRPTILTPKVTAALCEELRLGLTVAQACALAGVKESRFHEWRAKGEEDRVAELRTVYAEFAHAVEAAQVLGDRACLLAMDRGVTAGARRSKGQQAIVDIRAGDLATRVWALKKGGQRGAEQRWGPRETPAEEPTPHKQESAGDLRRLSEADLDDLERIILKMRGAEGDA
jgi:hypothetical protein